MVRPTSSLLISEVGILTPVCIFSSFQCTVLSSVSSICRSSPETRASPICRNFADKFCPDSSGECIQASQRLVLSVRTQRKILLSLLRGSRLEWVL